MNLGQGMLIPALPVLADTFGVSGAIAVQAITAQLVGRTISLIPAGAMVDRWGPRVPMIGGAALATVSAFGSAAAPNFLALAAMQLTWGVGMSTWMFGREVAAFDMVKQDQRGRQMAVLMGIGSTGSAMGPAVGGALTDALGIRGLFFVYAATCSMVLAISVLYKESSRPSRTRNSNSSLFSFRRVFDIHPYFRATYLILFFSTFAQMMRSQVTNTMVPLYAQDQLGYSPTTTGLLFTIIGVVTLAMIVPTGFISDKLGRKWPAAGAAAASTIGFILMPTADGLVTLGIVMAVIGLAHGLAMGAMTIYTYDIVPHHARGQLQAMRRGIGEFGALSAPPLAGVAAVLFSPGISFWFFAPLHALSFVMILFMAKESLAHKLAQNAPTPDETTAHRR